VEFLTQPPVIFDLVLVAIVLIFAILGACKGLILSLCSLLAVIVALIGGTVAANYLTPPLAEQAAPLVEGFLREHWADLIAFGSQALEQLEGFLPQIAQRVLEQQEWSAQAATFLPEFSVAVTAAILRPIIFLIAFVVVLIAWSVVSHALDLVARLPVLSTLNTTGGFLFGLAKGVLLLVVVCLAVQTFFPDLIPLQIQTQSRILALIQKAPAFF